MISKPVVLHISNTHSSFDDRIFYKELVSLSEYYDCYQISGGNSRGMLTTMGNDLCPQGIYDNVNIIPYPIRVNNYFLRAFRYFFPKIYYFFYNIIVFPKLKKLCIKRKIIPSILHYHDLDFSEVAIKLKNYFKCKLIFDCHEFYFSYSFEKGLNYANLKKASKSLLLLKNAVRTSDATISVTKNLDNIISLMNNNRPHVVVYNSSMFPFVNNKLPDITSEDHKIVLIHEGSMKFNRGLKLMLEIFKDDYFREKIKLKIIGSISGKELDYFQSKKQEYNIDDSLLELTGWINYTELYKHLFGTIGIIFFEKTFNAYYSMPIKLFNYINAGLPILSVHCAELSDFISNNKIGVIVERDIDSIKNGLNELITNYDYYKKNILEIQQPYSWETEKGKLFSLYKELLGKNAD